MLRRGLDHKLTSLIDAIVSRTLFAPADAHDVLARYTKTRHAEWLAWAGGEFDSEAFDPQEVKAALGSLGSPSGVD
jgi:hypothetical protein